MLHIQHFGRDNIQKNWQ